MSKNRVAKSKPIGFIGMQVALTMISSGRSSEKALEVGQEFSDKFGAMQQNEENTLQILKEFEEILKRT